MVWHNLIIHVMLAGTLTSDAGATPSVSQVTPGSTARHEISSQRLSQGCGRSAPEASATHLMVSGRRRQFILAVPKGYRTKQPQWLVFAFHGRTDDSAKVRGYYDLERHATHPTLFVYPSGLKDQSGRFTWSTARDQASALRDYAFFDALLADIGNQYCIALDHVYIVGHSLGASFGNSLACAQTPGMARQP